MAELGFISRIEISDFFFSRVPCFHYPKKVSMEIGMTFKRYLGNGTDRNGEGTGGRVKDSVFLAWVRS